MTEPDVPEPDVPEPDVTGPHVTDPDWRDALALGATARRVTGQIVGESLRTISGGALAGWVAVYAVYIHLVQGAPVTLSVFVGIPLALVAVAAVSSWLPARRASRVDPLVALRRE